MGLHGAQVGAGSVIAASAWEMLFDRLGSGTAPELSFEGFYQEAPTRDPAFAGRNDAFITSSDGTVIQLLPAGSQWQIMTPSAGT